MPDQDRRKRYEVKSYREFKYYFENNLIVSLRECLTLVHSKNSRVRFDPEKGPMGPDPFLGQSDLDSESV